MTDLTYSDLIRDAQTRLGNYLTPCVRLGVTGLSRSGKTVFTTALIQNLIESAKLPVLPGVQALAEQGIFTGASGRNWASYGEHIQLASTVTDAQKALLTDPQTSGGLLVSCAADAVQQVLKVFADSGFGDAAVIGRMKAGAPKVFVD